MYIMTNIAIATITDLPPTISAFILSTKLNETGKSQKLYCKSLSYVHLLLQRMK